MQVRQLIRMALTIGRLVWRNAFTPQGRTYLVTVAAILPGLCLAVWWRRQ